MANVVRLPAREAPAQRSQEAVWADMEAEYDRHTARMRALTAELAGAPKGAAPSERQQGKKQAAGALNISEDRLMSIIARHEKLHPDQPRIGVQPGGPGTTWIVYTERVKVFMEASRQQKQHP